MWSCSREHRHVRAYPKSLALTSSSRVGDWVPTSVGNIVIHSPLHLLRYCTPPQSEQSLQITAYDISSFFQPVPWHNVKYQANQLFCGRWRIWPIKGPKQRTGDPPTAWFQARQVSATGPKSKTFSFAITSTTNSRRRRNSVRSHSFDR